MTPWALRGGKELTQTAWSGKVPRRKWGLSWVLEKLNGIYKSGEERSLLAEIEVYLLGEKNIQITEILL